jgi:hypothetical protein
MSDSLAHDLSRHGGVRPSLSLVPGVNPLGAISSNALTLLLGFL